MCFFKVGFEVKLRVATANLSQARPNTPNFFDWLFLIRAYIETQNLGKAQALGALPAVAPLKLASQTLHLKDFFPS